MDHSRCSHSWLYIYGMEGKQMMDSKTIERIQQEVVSPNKDKLFQATLKEKETEVEKVKTIFKNSNGLDNISEEDMQIFKSFMLK